jgi:sodium/hydrogen exchanger-like protein 6/7/sodium/hydrogen exchanger 8
LTSSSDHDNTEDPLDEHELETETILEVFGLFLLLLLSYSVIGSWVETNHPPVGHETCIVLIIGGIASLIIYIVENSTSKEILVNSTSFNEHIFFEILLPMILFAAGFNMRRRKFFENFGNIAMFGIFSTLFAFIIFSFATWLLMKADFVKQYDPVTGEWEAFTLTTIDCVVVGALLCSSDIIAAISLVKYESEPRLFSLIFGEGIFNDAVAIILF